MKKLIVKTALLIISAALIIAGLADRGFNDVKNKAVMVCYECIGIG